MTRAAWTSLRARYRFARFADARANEAAERAFRANPLTKPGAMFWPARTFEAAVIDALPRALRLQVTARPPTAAELDPRGPDLRLAVTRNNNIHAHRFYERRKANVVATASAAIARAFPTPPAAEQERTTGAAGGSSFRSAA